jgi:hypothetical protein
LIAKLSIWSSIDVVGPLNFSSTLMLLLSWAWVTAGDPA